MFIDSFLVEKWGILKSAARNVCKNLINLDCQDSIRFDIYQVVDKWRIVWEGEETLNVNKTSSQK